MRHVWRRGGTGVRGVKILAYDLFYGAFLDPYVVLGARTYGVQTKPTKKRMEFPTPHLFPLSTDPSLPQFPE